MAIPSVCSSSVVAPLQPGFVAPPQPPAPSSAPAAAADVIVTSTPVLNSGQPAPSDPLHGIKPISGASVSPEMRQAARNIPITFHIDGAEPGNACLPVEIASKRVSQRDTLAAFPPNAANQKQLIAPHTVPVKGEVAVDAQQGRWLALATLVQSGSVNADDLSTLTAAAARNDTGTIDAYLTAHISKVTLTASDLYSVELSGNDLQAFFNRGSLVRSRAAAMSSPTGDGQIPDGFDDSGDGKRVPVGAMLSFRNNGHPLENEENYNVWQIADVAFKLK